MKKIILVRHGKAEEGVSDITDFNRSLTPKGKIISEIMAGKLKDKVNSPGLIISSPAFRALETALIFAMEFGLKPETIVLKDLIYFKLNYKSFSDILLGLSEEYETVTFFGHNPSFTDIAKSLCKEECDSMPKSGVVGISFKINTWKEITQKTGKQEFFLKPENTI